MKEKFIVNYHTSRYIFDSKKVAEFYFNNTKNILNPYMIKDYKEISKKIKHCKELAVEYYAMEDEDKIDKIFVTQADKLPKGWYWCMYDDGSGHLISPKGNNFMGYDLDTKEFWLTDNSPIERSIYSFTLDQLEDLMIKEYSYYLKSENAAEDELEMED